MGGGFTKYVPKTTSDGMIYIPSFIKISSGIQKLLGRYTQTHTYSKVIS
jgi:hypothetical protein